MAHVEDKGDWLAALVKTCGLSIPLAGRVPAPFFWASLERDPIQAIEKAMIP
jgi:hypothetical protein